VSGDPANDAAAVQVFVAGTASFQQLAVPFLVESVNSLVAEEGFVELADGRGRFELPDGWFEPLSLDPQNRFRERAAALSLGLSLFFSSGVGDWAVGRVCDAVWETPTLPENVA
jgi:hypothetical protein